MIDYKKIIKSRNIRIAILKMLNFIPDKEMIKLQYRIKTGRKLNLNSPQRYTEKVQWLKLYYRDPLMIQCADKYEVRTYVKNKELEHILNECYGVYDSVEEIEFTKLPQAFVVKDTLGCGGNSVVIVKNKDELDIETLKEICKKWVGQNHRIKDGGREWPYYSGKKHRIIIEKYIDSDINSGGLIDYKFLCFGGKTALVYVLADRKMGESAGCGFFSENFERLPYIELDERPLERELEKPENYEEMKLCAEKLSENFPCARVDLYDQDGEIIFGEITFFDSSGYMIFDPDELDFELGQKLVLPNQR